MRCPPQKNFQLLPSSDCSGKTFISGHLVRFIVVTTIGSWMLRILVLRYLSHVHLRADADERVTMITTYLALLREEAVTKEDDRQMILQTLFRPAATGIVKDNAAPDFDA